MGTQIDFCVNSNLFAFFLYSVAEIDDELWKLLLCTITSESNLVKENDDFYLLLPLQIFKLRKKMYQISSSSLSIEKKKSKMVVVYGKIIIFKLNVQEKL
ncbi:hypothetical protein [Clostridium magnum]|uniref:hypothetical protein n=1 Tax=Clostridium magnum TaxID=33954 RepID=UPI000831B5BB|nr:hypothetical protein [Clostridium magnum]